MVPPTLKKKKKKCQNFELFIMMKNFTCAVFQQVCYHVCHLLHEPDISIYLLHEPGILIRVLHETKYFDACLSWSYPTNYA